jgi:hypothetical protein
MAHENKPLLQFPDEHKDLLRSIVVAEQDEYNINAEKQDVFYRNGLTTNQAKQR